VGDVRVLAPALLAYALYLEDEAAQFEEAEDVLLMLTRVVGERLPSADRIAATLRLGRVLRKLTRWDEAEAAYAEAGRIAEAVGDRQSVLFSRIGHCNVVHFRGNLAEAELAWRGVLADAAAGGYRYVEANAEHGLGNILQRRGQSHEAAPHLWRAYELFEDGSSQLRALGDLGIVLLSLGDVQAAERALREVVRRGGPPELVANALTELMHCASFRRDRVGFERWREQGLARLEQELPNIRADYHLKVGIGLARFGNYRRAEAEMGRALDIAVAHELHEMVFRIERIKSGLQDCEALAQVESHAAEPAVWTEAVREVSASLATLSV
jgi:tetratricopeptide (TPR) repeat protein